MVKIIDKVKTKSLTCINPQFLPMDYVTISWRAGVALPRALHFPLAVPQFLSWGSSLTPPKAYAQPVAPSTTGSEVAPPNLGLVAELDPRSDGVGAKFGRSLGRVPKLGYMA